MIPYTDFQQSYISLLNETKRESEQARLSDSDIEKIKDEVDDEFYMVMDHIYDASVPMPEVTWNEDGSLDICWALYPKGTSTILLYGDGYAIYNTYLGESNYVRSVCNIRDNALLPKLIEILSGVTK